MLVSINRIATIEGYDVFIVLMGIYIKDWSFEERMPIWQVSCTCISNTYREVLRFPKNFNLDNKAQTA